MAHFNWMDGLQFSLGSLSFPLSLCLSLFCFLCIRLYSLRRLKHGLSDSYYLEAGKDGTSPLSTGVEKFQRKTLLTLAGLHAHPLNQLLWPVQNRNRHSQLGNCEQGIWTASCPRSRIRTTSQLDLQTVSLTPPAFTSGLSLRGPYRVPFFLTVAVQSASRLGKDLRF